MKTVGIDARLIAQTGVGVYIQNLLKNLSILPFTDIQFKIFVREVDSNLVSKAPHFSLIFSNQKWHSFAEQTSYFTQIMTQNLDLMHFTYFSYPVMYSKKFVMTIHDLIPYHFKTGKASTHNTIAYNLKHEAYKFVIKSAVTNASKIITPTNAVKTDIQNTFGAKYGDKIAVTYEGVREDILQLQATDYLKTKLTKPFFLYVGNFYPHKNINRLLQAFSQFADMYDLVLVGPNDYFAKKIKPVQGVILLTNIETSDLIFLYKNAQALVFPSLYEGFGLPLLEASYFNLPIIASNIDVFKEILGDSFLGFDPKNPADISEKIGQFIQDKSIIHSPVKEDLVNKFSFRKMTEQTLNIYKSLLS